MSLVCAKSIGRQLPILGAFRPCLSRVSCRRPWRITSRTSAWPPKLCRSNHTQQVLRHQRLEPQPLLQPELPHMLGQKLDLPALDKKWRATWGDLDKSFSPSAKDGSHEVAEDLRDSKYILPMFPYPSGNLHMGHLRVYTVADVLARYHKLRSNKIILPMGWDAFGLPAENAALERGINPATWTKDNIAKMKEQLQLMNGSWNWEREISTCDPEFYKHTQKIFLLLQEKELAYQAEAEVNYDPVDKTVLANEQVDANGLSWRSGAKVEKRRLKQWFLKISAYREALLQDLEVLAKDNAWPEKVLAMQKNWLGKSKGAMVKFPILAQSHDINAALEVFTTRPDTLFGVQYIALASTHPVVAELAKADPELQAFLDTLPGLPPDSKVGYMLPNLRVVNPLAYHQDTPDATKESLPVYVAPYVLGDYGEGAVMGVPGHDLRDNAFWKEHHYDAPVRFVLAASEDEATTALVNEPFLEHGFMTRHSGPFKGKSSREAGEMLVKMLEGAKLAKPVEKWRLRDWLVSRQRYWGTPIPIIHCDSCGTVPVPDDQLPVKLPEVDGHWAEGKPGNPLESATEWVNTSCPKCGGAAKRDTDTMDTFVDSSWYYMRFVDPNNTEAPFSSSKSALLPVDLYVGGIEHAILHLLYARFIYKFLMTSSLVSESSPEAVHEPFTRLVTQGMVHGKTFSDPYSGRFLKPNELDLADSSHPKIAASGETPVVSYEKMSKSKHNGVDPTAFIFKHGSDATRAHMLFQAPVSDVVNWDEEKISGVTRWLGRVHQLVLKVQDRDDSYLKMGLESKESGFLAGDPVGTLVERKIRERASLVQAGEMHGQKLQQWDIDSTVWRELQQTIISVGNSYDKVYTLNTVISDLMSLTNTIQANETADPMVRYCAVSSLVKMLAPVSPAFSSECWQLLCPSNCSTPLFFDTTVRFPVPDGTAPLLQPRLQPCAVQVNGKMRTVVNIPTLPPSLTGDEMKSWVIDEILKTKDGFDKLVGSGLPDIRSAKKIVVVRGGTLVNFVF